MPDFVLKEYVAGYLGREIKYLERIRLFDGVYYRVKNDNKREYDWKEILRRIERYQLMPAPKDHPNARYSQEEIVAELDIKGRTYTKLVREGKITVHEDARGRKFVLASDFDYFRRNYDIRYIVQSLSGTEKLLMGEAADIIGIKRKYVSRQRRRGTLKCVQVRGKNRVMKADLLNFLDSQEYKMTRKFRSEPFPDKMTFAMAKLYTGMSGYQLVSYIKKRIIHKDPSNPKYIMKDSLDLLILYTWESKCYGKGKCYYNEGQIMRKFGKTALWVDQYVARTCDVFTRTGVRMTYEEFLAKCGTHGMVIRNMLGWAQDDVERMVETCGDEMPEELVYSVDFQHRNKTDMRAHRKYRETIEAKKQATLEFSSKEMVQPVADDLELALQAAVMKKEFERQDARREIDRKVHAEIAKRNKVRSLLNMELELPRVQGLDMYKMSTTPVNIYIVYSRSKVANLFTETHPEKGAYTLQVGDRPSFLKKRGKHYFTVFRNLYRAYRTICKIHAPVDPAWVVIVPGTSRITDLAFTDKLKNVPPEYGAVGAYGYEYFLPDSSWVKCPATYGMYTSFNADLTQSKWVMGSRGCNGSHEVAVIDGPFIAIRGRYWKALKTCYRFRELGNGAHGLVSYLLSITLGKFNVKLLQIPVECSMCEDLGCDTETIDWNQAEIELIKFKKALVELDF